MNSTVSIDVLIEVVKAGGTVKTGVDIYSKKGILLLDKDIIVDTVKVLEIIKDNGVNSLPVNPSMEGGLWDNSGNQIVVGSNGLINLKSQNDKPDSEPTAFSDEMFGLENIFPDISGSHLEMRILEIEEIKRQAAEKYHEARQNIKKVLDDIQKTGGNFDYNEVASNVSSLVDFMTEADNPFSYFSQEMFSYDGYLYNHSINVCTIGTAILNQFNNHFSRVVDDLIKGQSPEIYNPFEFEGLEKSASSYRCYYEEDLSDISLGFFLHDIGKTQVASTILNKQGRLTDIEFDEVKKHSYDYGVAILDKNQIKNSVIRNIVNYHHSPLYENEYRCYPEERPYNTVPLYARICKLADIYDAMTSKRSYKEAINPINVVTQIFRTYAKKDRILQYILHAFVKSIGIYPAGSIIYLRNGQMAYVLESSGPIVIPFTDEQENTLSASLAPIDIGEKDISSELKVDNRRSVKKPIEVWDRLPQYIKSITASP